jgi:MoaA/NifB/PqqE/SkfB family radical SAM enzyme
VIRRAREAGAFRFNTGKLMRVGTAARLWERLEPDGRQYEDYRALLAREAASIGKEMEICYSPFTLGEAMSASLREPPATLLVLPNGRVKVAAALPYLCADLRRDSLAAAWMAYRGAWKDHELLAAMRGAVDDESHHADANNWRWLKVSKSEHREAKWAT